MATQRIADWQRSDRRLFAAVAILFPILVLIGFGRTYYLSTLVGGPPVKSLLVHVHGALMTLWIALFVTQVFLIRAHQRALHKVLGWYGVALAGAMVVAGVLTAAAAGKYGSLSAPPEIPPLVFMAIPMTDLLMFVVFFGAAIYWRTRAAAHKRLMLMTVLNFLPPAIARIPIPAVRAAGPAVFFGVPTLLTIGLIVYDTRRTGSLNRIFLVAGVALIASYPLRIIVGGTGAWHAFAQWLTSWAA